jgi:hypothetical protein
MLDCLPVIAQVHGMRWPRARAAMACDLVVAAGNQVGEPGSLARAGHAPDFYLIGRKKTASCC